jgi:hypothetical protein
VFLVSAAQLRVARAGLPLLGLISSCAFATAVATLGATLGIADFNDEWRDTLIVSAGAAAAGAAILELLFFIWLRKTQAPLEETMRDNLKMISVDRTISLLWYGVFLFAALCPVVGLFTLQVGGNDNTDPMQFSWFILAQLAILLIALISFSAWRFWTIFKDQ